MSTSHQQPGPNAHSGSVAFVLALSLFLTGCASTQPILYSGKTDSIVKDERAQKHLAECQRNADQRVGRNSLRGEAATQATAGAGAKAAAQKVGSTGAIAFAATAVGSIVSKSKGAWERARGAGAGGAAGMATKLALEWNQGDEVYQKYVENCLEKRGHEVLGWR